MQINVLEYLESSSIKFGNKTAIIDGENKYSFKDVITCSKSIGTEIIKKGNIYKQPIAVYLPKSAEAIMSFFGILYSRNIYVPLDVKSPQRRLSNIIDNLNPPLIITLKEYSGIFVEMGIEKSRIYELDLLSTSLAYSQDDIDHRLANVIDSDPAYIIYTSGSTGTPKGVVISHKGIIDYIDWARNCFKVSDREIIGNQSPFYFDNSTLDIYLSISSGATLCLIPEGLFAFPVKLLDYLIQRSVNFIFWVPSILISIANMKLLEERSLKGHLKKVLFAGEVMPNKQLNYWRQHLPDIVYANLYGPTEITVDCTYYIVDRKFEDHELLPIGTPCRNSDVIILNEQNRIVKAGEIGELCVRGSSLALGYWNDFVKTSQAFVQNPLNLSYPEMIYRTGDLVYINEFNEIIYVGRKDFQIKHQGYRIELGEIEAAVLAVPDVFNACILYNSDEKEICLFYESTEEISSRDFRIKLMNLLPKYMLPNKFYHYKELPINANGKIDRPKLAGIFTGKTV